MSGYKTEPADNLRPKKQLSIALDYDECFTEDTAFWRGFIRLAHNAGHKVTIVTARIEKNIDEVMRDCGHICPIIFTSQNPKREHCERHGARFDIWIDDRPETITGDYS